MVVRMKMKAMTLGLMAAGMTAAVAGCGTNASSPAAQDVATVQKQPVTTAQLTNFVAMTEFFQGSTLPNNKQEKALEVKALVQQTAVNQWALAHHLITMKSASNQASKLIKTQIESQVGGAKGLDQLLKSKHLAFSTLQTYVTQQMVTQSAFTYATKKVKAPTTAAEEQYYNKNKVQFTNPQQDEINDIVVKTQATANNLLSELQHGANFAQLAQKNSISSTAKSGGNLGYLPVSPQGGMSLPMYEAVLSMKVGQYKIYHGSQGYHVIELQATKPSTVTPFSQVQSQVKSLLLQQSQDNVYQAFANKVEKSMKITINK